MNIFIAYGSPGSGKSTFLLSLGLTTLHLDKETNIVDIKNLTIDFFKLNNEIDIIIDAPFFSKEDISIFINNILSKIINIDKLTIYDFKFDKSAALLNDKSRNRELLCQSRIKNYKYLELSKNTLNLNVDEIAIIKKSTFKVN